MIVVVFQLRNFQLQLGSWLGLVKFIQPVSNRWQWEHGGWKSDVTFHIFPNSEEKQNVPSFRVPPYRLWNKLQFVYAMETKEEEVVENAMTFIARIFNEIVSSPLNLALLGAIGYVAYKIIATQMEERKVKPEEPPLPKVRFKSLVNMFVN